MSALLSTLPLISAKSKAALFRSAHLLIFIQCGASHSGARHCHAHARHSQAHALVFADDAVLLDPSSNKLLKALLMLLIYVSCLLLCKCGVPIGVAYNNIPQHCTNSSCFDKPLRLLSLSAIMYCTCYQTLSDPVQMQTLSVWTVLVTGSGTGPALLSPFINVCFLSVTVCIGVCCGVKGMGWTCLEELVWGDKEHKWVKPGVLHTRGPGDLGPANFCSLVCIMLFVADA